MTTTRAVGCAMAAMDVGHVQGHPVLICGLSDGRCAIRAPGSLGLRAHAYLRWAAAQRLDPPLGGVLRDRRSDRIYFLVPSPRDWERSRVEKSVASIPTARLLAEGAMVMLPAMGDGRSRWLRHSPHPTDIWSVLAALRVAARAAREGVSLRTAALHEDLGAFARALAACR